MPHSIRKAATTALLAGGLLLGASAMRAQTSAAIEIGPPPYPRIVSTAGQARPGPGFVWIAGYWYPVYGHYVWRDGHWTRPPHPGAAWVPPHHDGHRFFPGYWEEKRTRDERDRRSDADADSRVRIKPVSDEKQSRTSINQ
jgi:hypothetical protein